VALTCCSIQVKALLGLKFEADGFLAIITGIIERISETRFNDSMLSLVCITLLLFMQRLQIFFPSSAANCSRVFDKVLWFLATARSGIVVIVAPLVSILYPGTFQVIGVVESGLPSPAIPPFSFTGT
jgi:sodium-independent sulfate anion transporter 11